VLTISLDRATDKDTNEFVEQLFIHFRWRTTVEQSRHVWVRDSKMYACHL